MNIEEALFAYLQTKPDVTSIVGNRVYPMLLPQGSEYPAIVYQRISGMRVRSHSGPSSLAYPRIQFSCWAQTYSDAKRLAERLRVSLDGYRGTVGDMNIQAIFVENDIDLYDAGVSLYRTIVDAKVWHEEVSE